MITSTKSPFYKCNHCGNFVFCIDDKSQNFYCCNEEMEMVEIHKNHQLKMTHTPILAQINSVATINVGAKPHSMTKDHYIMWVVIVTLNGYQMRYLKPDDNPSIKFYLIKDEIKEIYAYCNQHGLSYKLLIKDIDNN